MTGALVHGHFGEWLQGRLGEDGPVVLVTVACQYFQVSADGIGGENLPFSDEARSNFLEQLGLDQAWPDLHSNIPLGVGAGASTATLVAAARRNGFDGSPEALAAACLATEGATDPLMFEHPDERIWASREARTVEQFPAPPSCEIVGGFWGPPEVTDPRRSDFPDITDLVAGWGAATRAADLNAAAAVASTSAERLCAYVGADEPIGELAKRFGALGHLRAHTGSARGLIFAPGEAPAGAEDTLLGEGLTSVIRFRTGGT